MNRKFEKISLEKPSLSLSLSGAWALKPSDCCRSLLPCWLWSGSLWYSCQWSHRVEFLSTKIYGLDFKLASGFRASKLSLLTLFLFCGSPFSFEKRRRFFYKLRRISHSCGRIRNGWFDLFYLWSCFLKIFCPVLYFFLCSLLVVMFVSFLLAIKRVHFTIVAWFKILS